MKQQGDITRNMTGWLGTLIPGECHEHLDDSGLFCMGKESYGRSLSEGQSYV